MNKVKLVISIFMVMTIAYGIVHATEENSNKTTVNSDTNKPFIFFVVKKEDKIIYEMDGKIATLNGIRLLTSEKVSKQKNYPIIIVAKTDIPWSVVYNLENTIAVEGSVDVRYFFFMKKSMGMVEYFPCKQFYPFSTKDFPECEK